MKEFVPLWFVFASGSHAGWPCSSSLHLIQPHSESLLQMEPPAETLRYVGLFQCTPGPQLSFPRIGSTEDNRTENSHNGVFRSPILIVAAACFVSQMC